jgi:predicted ATPase
MKLKSITLSGYKSINQEGATISFGDITVLLGANGVGKSNLVSFFSILNAMLYGHLQHFIGLNGFADSFLNFGVKNGRYISGKIEVYENITTSIYQCLLNADVEGNLLFINESYKESLPLYNFNSTEITKESAILSLTKSVVLPSQIQTFIDTVFHWGVYRFGDTSIIIDKTYIDHNQYLNHDASNLAAFLYRLKENPNSTKHYERIVRYVQKAMPQFGNFDLNPNAINAKYITLNWREKGNTDYLFGPHQISDGSLRFMALATLLLQPEELLPKVMVLDEPELGLHPSAIGYLAGMIKAASKHCQVVIATQSQRLVDEFEVENIVVVERNKITNNTEFKRKTAEELSDWLDNYSLGELWEKNVIGGQP